MKKFLEKYKTALLYVFLFLLLFGLHFCLKLHTGDDVFFGDVQLSGLGEFLQSRYHGWTSRILIEMALVVLCDLPDFVWCFLDTLIILWLIRSVSYVFTKNGFKENLIVAVLTMVFPVLALGEAGWYATTLNYLWPLAFGMFALVPIKNLYVGKPEKWYNYPLYLISLIFACNQEQMCAIVLAFYLIFTIYFGIKRKKPEIFMIIQTLFALSSIIFIFTCPGNMARLPAEIEYWFNDYKNFNFFDKLVLGVNSTMSQLLTRADIPVFIFVIMLPILLRKARTHVKVLSYIPAIFVAYCFCGKLLMPYISFLNKLPFLSIVVSFATQPTAMGVSAIILFLINVLLLAIIVYMLFVIGGGKSNLERSLFIPLVFLAGIMSGVVLGFSPTLYTGHRIYTFFTISLVCVLALCIKNLFQSQAGLEDQNPLPENQNLPSNSSNTIK